MIKRIISWIIMIGIAIPVILIGGDIFNVAIVIIAMLATREIIKIREKHRDVPTAMKLITYFFVLVPIGLSLATDIFNVQVNYEYLVALVLMFFVPLVFYHKQNKYNINDACYLIGAVLLIGIASSLFILFRNIRMAYIIYILLITISTDTFGLIAGLSVGKNKLTPISPKKSWEGAIYGTFMATVIASLFYINVIDPNINILSIILATIFIAVMAQIGDLVFSAIKREFKEKDYSNLIPGHGGVLDRIDSIIFALLAFALVLPFL